MSNAAHHVPLFMRLIATGLIGGFMMIYVGELWRGLKAFSAKPVAIIPTGFTIVGCTVIAMMAMTLWFAWTYTYVGEPY